MENVKLEFSGFHDRGVSIPPFYAYSGERICLKIGENLSLREIAISLAERVVAPGFNIISYCVSDASGNKSDTTHSWLTRALHGNASSAGVKLIKLRIAPSVLVKTLGGNDRRLLSAAAAPANASMVIYDLYGLDPEGRFKLSEYLSDEHASCALVQLCFQGMPDDAIMWPSGSGGRIIDAE